MFLIHCPHCGEAREEDEFHPVGQAHIARPLDPDACSDQEWGDYLYFRDNPKGEHRELWVHAAGCRKYFNILRDTASYRIRATYRVGENVPANDSVDEHRNKYDNAVADVDTHPGAHASPPVDSGPAQSARSARKHAALDGEAGKRQRTSSHSAGQGVDKLVAGARKPTRAPKARKEK